MEKAKGFSDAQRRWFLARDQRCQFHYVLDGHWVRCNNTEHLEIHHIVPRGYASRHYPEDFPLNGAYNGIVLCKLHHTMSPTGVHPDTFKAHNDYVNGNKNAYNEMVQKRYELNKKGIPYWNTQYDLQFVRIVEKANVSFLRTHPYPDKGKYGKTGRAK